MPVFTIILTQYSHNHQHPANKKHVHSTSIVYRSTANKLMHCAQQNCSSLLIGLSQLIQDQKLAKKGEWGTDDVVQQKI